MSRHDFSIEEFQSRRQRIREELQRSELDWLVAFHPVTIHWLTGSEAKSYQEFQCLLLSAHEGPVIVIAREGERFELEDDALIDELVSWNGGEPQDPLPVFERVAKRHGLLGKRIGLERPAYYLYAAHDERIRAVFGDSSIADATHLVADLKLVKSPAELAHIRTAAKNADRAMQVFTEALQEGRSEAEIAGDVYRDLVATGATTAASPMNLVSGERSCYSHGAPSHRLVRRGDTGHIEYGALSRRYTATIGRQFSIGPPSARVLELYSLIHEAQDAAAATICDGATSLAAHEAAKAVIAAAGLDRARMHTTGYGLAPGFPPSWAEPLHLFPGRDYTLRAGMVLTIEPAVFLKDERLGVRLIDNVVVTDSGVEWLTRSPRELIVAP